MAMTRGATTTTRRRRRSIVVELVEELVVEMERRLVVESGGRTGCSGFSVWDRTDYSWWSPVYIGRPGAGVCRPQHWMLESESENRESVFLPYRVEKKLAIRLEEGLGGGWADWSTRFQI